MATTHSTCVGKLIADGTVEQPIHFHVQHRGHMGSHSVDDTNVDAIADAIGNYVRLDSALRDHRKRANGLDCTTATPYLSHVSLNSGGVVCSLGATPFWLQDSSITGTSAHTGTVFAYRNAILADWASWAPERKRITSSAAVGFRWGAESHDEILSLADESIGGTGGHVEDNNITGGNLSAAPCCVLNNTATGSLNVGNASTVDHNTTSRASQWAARR